MSSNSRVQQMLSFLESEVRPANHFVVAFTGAGQALGGIPFEFYKSLGHIDCAALFVKDSLCRWYQYDPDEIVVAVERIKSAIASTGASKTLFLGNSMGGFGALLFGSLCGANSILSFVPQTAIDPAVTEPMGDRRYIEYQQSIHVYPYGDLTAIPPPAARITFCYGVEEALDIAHVERLTAVWRGEKIAVEGCGHKVTEQLKESGHLIPLIAKQFLISS